MICNSLRLVINSYSGMAVHQRCTLKIGHEGQHGNAEYHWMAEPDSVAYKNYRAPKEAATVLYSERAGDSNPLTTSRAHPSDTLRRNLRPGPPITAPGDYNPATTRMEPHSNVYLRNETSHPAASGLTYAKVFAFMGLGLAMWAVLFWIVIAIIRTWETFP